MANQNATTGRTGGGEQGRSREVARSGEGRAPYFPDASDFLRNPYAAMRRMHDDMDRMFAEAIGGRGSEGGGGMSMWSPAVEVSERDNELRVCAELPGLKPEDVKVEIDEDALVIQGERKEQHETGTGERRRTERRYGRFFRKIPLPEGANADQARADFNNGELHITIPVQRAETKRRQIQVESGGSSTDRPGKAA